jgi:hypothetical protein
MDTVSFVTFESACTRLERSNRRLFILCIILIVALVASNTGWVIYESQFQDVEVTQEVEQDAQGDGSNQFVGGDFYAPADSEGE